MTPLPANNTARFYFDYSVSGIGHTLIMRVEDSATAVEASAAWDQLIGNVGDGFFASELTGMRYQAKNLDFSIPAIFSGTETSWGSSDGGDVNTPAFAGMAGRGGDGRKVTWHLFGYKQIPSVGDYRFNVAGVSGWEDQYNDLQASEGVWLTVGGTQPTWHAYVNVGYNSYWQRKERS